MKMRYYLLLALGAPALLSCDFRRKDKIVDDSAKLTEQALKDSTTVQLIDSTYDFGTIAEGEKVEYNYRFKNTGTKPLVIITASSTCGCTVPEKPEKPIMPGEIGYIKVIFNSQGKVGQTDKPINVTSNANPPFGPMHLTGKVERKG